MMHKVLIPNRGEIAARIIRAAHHLGIKTVVCLVKEEQNSIAAQLSDEVHYFEGSLEDTYLNIDLIIQIAKQYETDCLHPGYGFLSENHRLAEACDLANIMFIGPSANHLQQMGDKQMARAIARKANVSIAESWEGNIQEILVQAGDFPYPVLIKAAMGGGGKGMKACYTQKELVKNLPAIALQAQRYFGDNRIYVEQYIEEARHIEVQLLADQHGHHIHLFDRECSIQRRFQKLIEEAPAPNLDDEIRQRIFKEALRLSQTINYHNAGTIEFLVDKNGQHYFLEMNTRIQVEHCVTEEITGIDLVQWQFRIANGEHLSLFQEDIKCRGHAIEARICAEDPDNNFQPSPGQITHLITPKQPGIRIEAALNQPGIISPQFDPMIAKLVVSAKDRAKAIQLMRKANRSFVINGVSNNNRYIQNILSHHRFSNAKCHTKFCDEHHQALTENDINAYIPALLGYLLYRHSRIGTKLNPNPHFYFKANEQNICAFIHTAQGKATININKEAYTIDKAVIEENSAFFNWDGKKRTVYIFQDEEQFKVVYNLNAFTIQANDWLPAYHPKEDTDIQKHISLNAPIPGHIIKVKAQEGRSVKKGDLLMVLDAMKTENEIKAWKDGVIHKVHIKSGDQVKLNQLLMQYQD